MAAASSKILDEAMKLPVDERVRVAEKLLESADAEGYDQDSEAAINAAWADELQQRSRELTDGSVLGLSIEDAHRIVASDPADDEH
jgi:putative addiction module component (TIGR02574 family)